MFRKKNTFNPQLENWKMAWHGRDFELSHLWQRSIFITTFIILTYTGYGAIWLNFFKCNFTLGEFLFFISNIVSIFIATLGYILSLLYIMMGKGSKYWYERYEEYILDIEKDSELCVMKDLCKRYFKVDESLLSRDAGKYSVSKINILLGQISAGVWLLIFTVHIVILLCIIYPKLFNFFVEYGICFIILFIVVILIFLVAFIPSFLKDKAKSNIND